MHIRARRYEGGFGILLEAFTHELISDELFPLLFFSFCCYHRPVSLKHPLQLGVAVMGLFKHV